MATLTAASSSSSSSPRCVPFAAFRRGAGERRAGGLPAPAGASGAPAGPAVGCGRPLCRAVELVGGGIRGAFFASLDRCSCVELRTKHDDSFRVVDAAAVPLMRDGGGSYYRAASSPGDDGSSVAAAAAGCGRRRAASGKAKQRRGIGCCAAYSTNTQAYLLY